MLSPADDHGLGNLLARMHDKRCSQHMSKRGLGPGPQKKGCACQQRISLIVHRAFHIIEEPSMIRMGNSWCGHLSGRLRFDTIRTSRLQTLSQLAFFKMSLKGGEFRGNKVNQS
jgi:hypothetical protein